MRGISFKIGLLGMSLLAGPVAAGELLEATVRWTAKYSPGTNSVAHLWDKAYVAGGTTLRVLSLESGQEVNRVDLDTDRFGAITGVAAHGKLVALTVTDSAGKTEPGWLLIYRASNMKLMQELRVGFGPDMLTFSPQGDKILVANEGEPECGGEAGSETLTDKEGSITVIELDHNFALPPHTADFKAFNGHEQELIAKGVRIFTPGATAAQDLEPEHIAVDPSGEWAWVTLQENNAIAKLDLRQNPPHVADIIALGYKNYGEPGNELDVSDKDKLNANLQLHPGLFGMYQPDGIQVGFIGGQNYLFTANEGDARDYYPCFIEEQRVGGEDAKPPKPKFDPLLLASPLYSQKDALSRLRVTTTRGYVGSVYNQLFAFGGRSFAIWDTDGNMVYDSGSAIEEFLATRPDYPDDYFPGRPDYIYDARSDDKGPEPEDVAWGVVDGGSYLFVGLERANGVIVFDFSQVTDVSQLANVGVAAFLGNPPGVGFDAEGEIPERLDFVPALESPTGKALLLVTNEVSGITRAFELSAPQ